MSPPNEYRITLDREAMQIVNELVLMVDINLTNEAMTALLDLLQTGASGDALVAVVQELRQSSS